MIDARRGRVLGTIVPASVKPTRVWSASKRPDALTVLGEGERFTLPPPSKCGASTEVFFDYRIELCSRQVPGGLAGRDLAPLLCVKVSPDAHAGVRPAVAPGVLCLPSPGGAAEV